MLRQKQRHTCTETERACRSGLWIKADGHGLLCAGFSCSLGLSLFLALWGSVRGFEWPYKTTVWLTLPPPHRKQAQSEVRWHSSPPKCQADKTQVGAEEDPEPLDVSSISISALPGGRRVQQCYRYGASSPKVFPSGERSDTAGLRQDRRCTELPMLLFAKIAGVKEPSERTGPNGQGTPYSVHKVSTGELAVERHSNHTEKPQPLVAAGLLAKQYPDSTPMYMLAAHQIVPSFPALETKQPQVVISKASEGGWKGRRKRTSVNSQFIKKGKTKVT